MKAKGHWPRGKPRHPPIPPARVARVRRFFAAHRTMGRVENDRSIQNVAAAIGVSDRAVRRWLRREHNPAPALWRELIAHLETLGL